MLYRIMFLAAALSLPVDAWPQAPSASASGSPLDSISLEGLKLGVTEQEVIAKFPKAEFTAIGSLHKANLMVNLTDQQGLVMPDAQYAIAELTTMGGKVVSMAVRYYPRDFELAEKTFETHLGIPDKDKMRTYHKKGPIPQELHSRSETWFGNSGYLEYRRFTLKDTRQSFLMFSTYPKQTNRDQYGPLLANLPTGADFYISQDGKLVRTEHDKEKLVFHLKNGPFEIGSDSDQVNLALAWHDMGEFKMDLDPTSSDRISCFNPMYYVISENDELFVGDGRLGCEGTSSLDITRTKKAKPLFKYRNAYQIDKLYFDSGHGRGLDTFKGTLHGFIQVKKSPDKSGDGIHTEEIAPIELIFE